MSDVTIVGHDYVPPTSTEGPTEGTPPTETLGVEGDGRLTPSEAGRLLASYRQKRDTNAIKVDKPIELRQGETAEAAIARDTSQEEIPEPVETTGEQTEAAEPEEAPQSLELPRSWSKDEAEIWNAIPPEAQEVILRRADQGSKAVRSAQNESAEQRKTLEAERAKYEQATQQLTQATQQALYEMQTAQMGEFADIKTQADVEKMAREDWPRFSVWQAKQMALHQRQAQMQQLQELQQKEFRQKWEKFASDEDAKFAESARMTEGEQSKLRDASLSYLKSQLSFTDQDLSKLWNGENSLSLRDHRVQLLIRDAVRYRQAQTAAKTKAVKPVPVVQRPGSPAARVPETEVLEQRLSSRLDQTGNWKDAAELLIAQRNRRR